LKYPASSLPAAAIDFAQRHPEPALLEAAMAALAAVPDNRESAADVALTELVRSHVVRDPAVRARVLEWVGRATPGYVSGVGAVLDVLPGDEAAERRVVSWLVELAGRPTELLDATARTGTQWQLNRIWWRLAARASASSPVREALEGAASAWLSVLVEQGRRGGSSPEAWDLEPARASIATWAVVVLGQVQARPALERLPWKPTEATATWPPRFSRGAVEAARAQLGTIDVLDVNAWIAAARAAKDP
jgi:hypothetical protein